MMIGENPSEQSPEKNCTHDGLSKLGLLVAGIAHNLYGPLTGIMGTLDLLKLKHPGLSDDFERVSQLGHRLEEEIKGCCTRRKWKPGVELLWLTFRSL
jgi:nitrogen-specific signal transduction histidine kinase